MIFDHLDNAEAYLHLHPLLADAAVFLRRDDLAELPDGRCEIDGERAYAMVNHCEAVGYDQARLEGHRRYIDVHYLISGREQFGWSPAAHCTSEKGYVKKKDCILFEEAPLGWLIAPPGTFTLFTPADAHAPAVGEGTLHKVVVKLAVED